MSMMHSGAELAKILKYHVVDGRITPTEFQAGMTPKTLEGDTLELSKIGAVYAPFPLHCYPGDREAPRNE
jgi:hypothetical protein